MTDQAFSRETKLGAFSAISSYVLWGIFPLFYKLLAEVNVYVIIAHRAVWSAVFVALFLFLVKRLDEIAPVFRSKRSIVLLLGSTITLSLTCTVFVWAVNNNHVLAASFGYFMNPLVSVALGMVLLGERQSKLQILAISIAVLAVIIQAIDVQGGLWISMILAISFAVYGYFRKTVEVGSAPGFLIETSIITPFAIGFLLWFGPTTPVASADAGISLWALLILCGPITAVPLILFAFGAKRLRLSTIGIFQYIAPSLHFLVAVLILGEELSAIRLLSFVFIWGSLMIFSYDSFLKQGRGRDDQRRHAKT